MRMLKLLPTSLFFIVTPLVFSAHIMKVSDINPNIKNTGLTIKVPDPTEKVESNWCVFDWKENTLGEWTVPDEDAINLEGKNIAIVVPGQCVETIINAFLHLTLPSWVAKKVALPEKEIYRLDETVHLGRYLFRDAKMLNDPTRNRFDIVLGFGHNTAYPLKTLGKHFAEELRRFVKSGKNVVIVTHSMGALVARWALEKEGCGEDFKHLITLGGPHQGVPAPISVLGQELLPDNYVSMIDMVVASPKPEEDDLSPFLWELNKDQNPYYETANYFTLAGMRNRDLTINQPPLDLLVKDRKDNAGALFQGIVNFFVFTNEWIPIKTDGLIATFSAHSDMLLNKSRVYNQNPDHSIVVQLNHRTITGSSHGWQNTTTEIKPTTPQFAMNQIMNKWLKMIPIEE